MKGNGVVAHSYRLSCIARKLKVNSLSESGLAVFSLRKTLYARFHEIKLESLESESAAVAKFIPALL